MLIGDSNGFPVLPRPYFRGMLDEETDTSQPHVPVPTKPLIGLIVGILKGFSHCRSLASERVDIRTESSPRLLRIALIS